ncbi:MAG: DNA methylase [Oscillospiraceae bacterium]|nr:DNA methylase [Oscillospiraceae bacterium]
MAQRAYIAIDLKSFYASVECRERGLDPLDTHLVVADESRTDKTICLAVTPSLKSYGIPGRARLFEVRQRVEAENRARRRRVPGGALKGSSYSAAQLKAAPEKALDFIVAPPRMAYYMEYSTWIYKIYTSYVAPEDIIVYSIDEVFMDVTGYLSLHGLSPRQLAERIIQNVLEATGITATAGIGTNLYLCKVAMDIVAKRLPADENGVRIAELDEPGYRRTLWTHRPLTDFWRVGRGIARKLEEHGMFTMGDVARRSVENEDLLYRLLGKNAELLIDHAWGWEPCTVADVKAYRPQSNSLSSGQVLQCPYPAGQARLVLREMADLLALELVDRQMVSDQIVITVGYDVENLTDPARRSRYHGPVVKDLYVRQTPKHAHVTVNLGRYSSSSKAFMEAAAQLFDRVVDDTLLIRRLNITANHVLEESAAREKGFEQLDLFTDYRALRRQQQREADALDRERKMQRAMLDIKKKFGKNAILKGMNLEPGATAPTRNRQIGGHRA